MLDVEDNESITDKVQKFRQSSLILTGRLKLNNTLTEFKTIEEVNEIPDEY